MDRYNENAGPTYNRFISGLKWSAVVVAVIAAVVVLIISRGS